MAKLIFFSCVIVFAVYGFIVFLIEILNDISYCSNAAKNYKVNIIVVFKETQDNVEGIIRDIVYKSAFRGGMLGEIYIAGTNLNDENKQIIMKLQREFDFIKVVDGLKEVTQ